MELNIWVGQHLIQTLAACKESRFGFALVPSETYQCTCAVCRVNVGFTACNNNNLINYIVYTVVLSSWHVAGIWRSLQTKIAKIAHICHVATLKECR